MSDPTATAGEKIPQPQNSDVFPAEEASELLAPVLQLLHALARVSVEHPSLTADQRAVLSSLTSDAEVIWRRILQLFEPPRPLVPPEVDRTAELPRMLLVDDDLVWLEAARDLLSRHFRVDIASDGSEAAELLSRDPPEVVISDLTMPRTGGMALLELVRGREDTAEIPVIVLSGSADTESKIRALERGAADYLTKPVALAELVARARNAITRAQALRRERMLQETDDLTGLANRRALRNILTSALRYAAASRKPLTVAMVDEDRLKQINDRYGHVAGDLAIKALSRALTSCKRGSDCAARYGGDEFCVVMPGTDRAGAEKFVARVEEELARSPLLIGTERVQVSASFGLASLGEVEAEEPWEALLARADAGLYEKKSQRRLERLATSAETFFDASP